MNEGGSQAEFEAASILKIFRILAGEFASVEDAAILQWMDLTRPMVSRKLFGNLYEQAVVLLTAHRMKIAGYGEEESDGENGLQLSVGDTLRVSSYSEGETSISFNSAASSTLPDSELTLTAYGMQYLSIRRMVIMPVRCSGEGRQ